MGGRRAAAIGAVAALVAVALPSPASAGIKYVSASAQLDPGQTAGITAPFCGSNKHHLLSGGSFISVGSAVTNASYPIDGSDGGEAPDDAWFIYMTNNTVIEATMSAYAICTTKAVRYSEDESPFTNAVRSFERCPKGSSATGVGENPHGGGSFVETWAPYDFITGSPHRTSAVVQGTGVENTFDETAICVGNMRLDYERDKLRIKPSNSADAFVRCPRGSQVVGGGATQPKAAWDLATTISIPSDTAQDADAKPDNSWRVSISNPSAKKRVVPVVAVCAK